MSTPLSSVSFLPLFFCLVFKSRRLTPMLSEGSESLKIQQLTCTFAFKNFFPQGNSPAANRSEGNSKCILKCTACFQTILEAFWYLLEVLAISQIFAICLCLDQTKAGAFLLWKVKLSYMCITSCSLILRGFVRLST